MAASPDYKVYVNGEYRAACKYPSDAGAVVAAYGEGAEVRLGHRIVLWAEGKEEDRASNSYDSVGQTCYHREYLWFEVSKRLRSRADYNGAIKTWNKALRAGDALVMAGLTIRTEQEER